MKGRWSGPVDIGWSSAVPPSLPPFPVLTSNRTKPQLGNSSAQHWTPVSDSHQKEPMYLPHMTEAERYMALVRLSSSHLVTGRQKGRPVQGIGASRRPRVGNSRRLRHHRQSAFTTSCPLPVVADLTPRACLHPCLFVQPQRKWVRV